MKISDSHEDQKKSPLKKFQRGLTTIIDHFYQDDCWEAKDTFSSIKY